MPDQKNYHEKIVCFGVKKETLYYLLDFAQKFLLEFRL